MRFAGLSLLRYFVELAVWWEGLGIAGHAVGLLLVSRVHGCVVGMVVLVGGVYSCSAYSIWVCSHGKVVHVGNQVGTRVIEHGRIAKMEKNTNI